MSLSGPLVRCALVGVLGSLVEVTALCQPIGLGTLYCRTGREDKGREELTAAMDMYRDMEMTYWLVKAEEAMVEVS